MQLLAAFGLFLLPVAHCLLPAACCLLFALTVFWLFFNICAVCRKVGRHCCRWHSAQEKEMPQQQQQQQLLSATVAAAVVATADVAAVGQLQLNTRCFSIVYIVNEKRLHSGDFIF